MTPPIKSFQEGTMTLKKLFEVGGFIAGAVMIVLFGVAVIALGVAAAPPSSNLKSAADRRLRRHDAGAIKDAADEGRPDSAGQRYPTCSVADKPINSGSRARCFAQYMQIHALESSGGLFYAEMGASRPRTATGSARTTRRRPSRATAAGRERAPGTHG